MNITDYSFILSNTHLLYILMFSLLPLLITTKSNSQVTQTLNCTLQCDEDTKSEANHLFRYNIAMIVKCITEQKTRNKQKRKNGKCLLQYKAELLNNSSHLQHDLL
jgi:hypothetical protein